MASVGNVLLSVMVDRPYWYGIGRVDITLILPVLVVARFRFRLHQSVWNLPGICLSAAPLPRCQSNFRAILSLQHKILQLRDLARFGGKTPYRLVNGGPGLKHWHWSSLTIALVKQAWRLWVCVHLINGPRNDIVIPTKPCAYFNWCTAILSHSTGH